jgi:hypothetical protein
MEVPQCGLTRPVAEGLGEICARSLAQFMRDNPFEMTGPPDPERDGIVLDNNAPSGVKVTGDWETGTSADVVKGPVRTGPYHSPVAPGRKRTLHPRAAIRRVL